MIKLSDAIDETNKAVTNELIGAGLDMNEMTVYLAQTVGKGVRTRLLLNASMNGEGFVPQSAVKAAAAIELLHMATLVHDDVIDDSPLRRGAETVQSKFGKKRAVICGDYLLCLSLSLLSSIEPPESMKKPELGLKFARTLSRICHGEHSQLQNSGNIELDLYAYLKIISGKTAALFYTSAYLGSLLGNENENNARSIGRFGQCLGMIFQIIDDCKDYEFSEDKALKPIGSDISGGVVTLPLIMALKKEPSLRSLALETMSIKQHVPRLIESVCRLGGPNDAREIARKYEKKAMQALRGITGIKKDNLSALMQKALESATQF